MVILFILYLLLYIINVTGYYDGSIRKKVYFTSEQIEEFEKDVENGVEIDLKKYLNYQNKDYTNNISNLGYKLSSGIDHFFNKTLRQVAKILNKLFS